MQRFIFLCLWKLCCFVVRRAVKTFGQSCTLTTLRSEEFVLTSVNSVVIAELVVMFLEGLKKRSQYAIAMQESRQQGNCRVAALAEQSPGCQVAKTKDLL